MLFRKMIREIKENKGAYLASAVIIFLGLLIFTSLSAITDVLQKAQQNYYEKYNFADGFIQVKAVPRNEVKKLEDIDGIKKIRGRLIKDVLVLKDSEKTKNTYLRLVSVDLDDQNPINGIHFIRGLELQKGAMAVWTDDKFFEANNLSINDEIEIVASGKKVRISVAGAASSPEFVYALRNSAELFPSPETFGIGFMPISSMEKLFPEEKAYNNLVFTLEKGADFDKVKAKLESKLKPFGLLSIMPRDQQISHLLLTEEIKGVASMSKVLPVLFLSIAAVILIIILNRLIQQQRSQIGILKAEGYTSKEIMLHYMSYTVIIGLTGGLFGALAGAALSYPMAGMYRIFFNLPGLEGSFSAGLIIWGTIISLSFSVVAGYQGSKSILTLEPAKALRPPAPVSGNRIFLERIKPIWDVLGVQSKMAVRNLFRNKGRSIFIFVGIIFCFAISSFTWSMNDTMQKVMFDQYEKVEVYDVKMSFAEPVSQKKAVRELKRVPGVTRVEPLAEVPATLKNKWLTKDVVILGLSEDSQLYNILDKDDVKITPPKDGLLLSERLAELLDAQVGTVLDVESPMKEDGERGFLKVAGIVPQYTGINAYMEIGALQDFLRQKDFITSCMITAGDDKVVPLLKEKYLYSHVVSFIEESSQRLEKLKNLMASYGSMVYIYVVFSVIIGFAIIYSSMVITLAERSRELASMMVLGMTPTEVLSVLTLEQWCIAVPAMLAGMPVASLLMKGLSFSMSTDVYTIPDRITPTSLMLSFAVTTVSIWIGQRTASRKMRNLSLVEVLKSPE